jgi:hypothetical protein
MKMLTDYVHNFINTNSYKKSPENVYHFPLDDL